MRAYKTVNDSYIEPISFTVPRRAEVFQSDIYPPAVGTKPAVSASEWLSGKDGVPSKIDLESIYDGNAPVEIVSNYKPPVAAAAPVKAPAPAPRKEEPAPTPVQRAPPPTMSEQKGSIAAMASRYQDDGESDDEDDASSFEEISKPVQRTAPVLSKIENKTASPIKTSPTKTMPSKPEPVSQATPRSTQPPAASSTPTTIPTSSGPISAVGSSSSSTVEASLEQIKDLLRMQHITINKQSEKLTHLASEVDTLKMRVGSTEQSERIRQLELELEAARS